LKQPFFYYIKRTGISCKDSVCIIFKNLHLF